MSSSMPPRETGDKASSGTAIEMVVPAWSVQDGTMVGEAGVVDEVRDC